jgi:hypothetical protein
MWPSNTTFLFRVPVFPECCARGRRSSPSAFLPRVSCSFRHSEKTTFPECNSSPSATLGKSGFPECPIFGTRGSDWHSGKIASPVVIARSTPVGACTYTGVMVYRALIAFARSSCARDSRAGHSSKVSACAFSSSMRRPCTVCYVRRPVRACL